MASNHGGMKDFPRRYHDLGGLMAGPVDQSDHQLDPWEKRVDVLRGILGDKNHQILTTDELRNAIENLGEEPYDKLSYYERWMAALINILKDKGVLTQNDVDQRMLEIKKRLGLEEQGENGS
ncbi:MAG: hypothetical protein WD005_05935 [Haliea sp.]